MSTNEGQTHTLDLSVKELLSLYVVLAVNEADLDDTQRDVFSRVCALVYDQLSIEQIEHIESFYASL